MARVLELLPSASPSPSLFLVVRLIILSVILILLGFLLRSLLRSAPACRAIAIIRFLLILRATVFESLVTLRGFFVFCVGSSARPLLMFIVSIGSPSPIEVLIRIIMLPFFLICIPTWGLVPEVFELILEEVLGPFLALIIARVVLVVVLGGLVALVEVPGRLLSLPLLLMLRPLVSVILVFLLGAAGGRATSRRSLLPLRVWVVIYFSELVIEGALSFIFEDFVGGVDLLELFLECLVPLGFVRVIFLS